MRAAALKKMKLKHLLWILIILCVLCITTLIIFAYLDKFYKISVFPKSVHLVSGAKEGAYLIVVILSTGRNIEKRHTIRNTWLKLGEKANFKYVFVIGKNYDRMQIDPEIRRYQDVIVLPVNDNYDALTSKVLHSFLYLHDLWKFRFLLKCDDDSFVRIPNVIEELQNKYDNVNNLYWGFFDGSAHIKKTGRWKETNWILCDYYLPYALGGGYVLSQSLVRFIADNFKYLNIYKTEDVSVGTWLSPVNVTRVHDPRFDTEFESRGCSNSYLVTHKQDSESMYNLYQSLKDTGKLCEQESKLKLSYQYDWSVPPSKCCRRHDITIP